MNRTRQFGGRGVGKPVSPVEPTSPGLRNLRYSILEQGPGLTIGSSRSSPWNSISRQILSTTASLLELSTYNLGPVGHPLQVQWVTQLPAGVLHILCSVTGALPGGHHNTLMVPVPCSMRGPSKRVMYQPVLGPGLNPRSKPCLRSAPAAGLKLIWLPGTWSASSCALLSHSIHAFRPQSHPTPTQRPSRCLSPGAALWTCCPGHNSLQWKLVEVGKG